MGRGKALIIGGSGFLSNHLVEEVKKTCDVWIVTRGRRPLPEGIHSIIADREDKEIFQRRILEEQIVWDVAFDCICMNERHAQQDIEVLSQVTKRVVLVSTDSVYDPRYKRVPQNEETTHYVQDCGYGENKRKMEKIFLNEDCKGLRWTIFRPGHIFGPGSQIGCFPNHSRQEGLVEYMKKENKLFLVGGGCYIIHPIYVEDLAASMVDCVEKEKSFNQVFCIGGPEAIENKTYYKVIGEILGVRVSIDEVPVTGFQEKHPEFSAHLCHRIYDLAKLGEAGVKLPSTSIKDGLKKQIEWLEECSK